VDQDGYLLIGKIKGAHGIRGMLKIISYAESVSVFEPGSLLWIDEQGAGQSYIIEEAKTGGKGSVLLGLKGVIDRTCAEDLAGSDLYIEKNRLPEPEDGEYYWKDLIGISVYAGDETFVGVLTSIIPTGSNDVYMIKDGKKEILIPALASVITDIDLANRIMRVDLPEGL
jgi:16S rRNA processing protein RimM